MSAPTPTPDLAVVRGARQAPLLSAREVWTALGIAKSTFYSVPVQRWFRPRACRPSPGRVGWEPSDVALYKALRTGTDAAPSAAPARQRGAA